MCGTAGGQPSSEGWVDDDGRRGGRDEEELRVGILASFANFRGVPRGNVSGNVEISRNISGYLLVSNICMQKDFLERRRCLRGKIHLGQAASCERWLPTAVHGDGTVPK